MKKFQEIMEIVGISLDGIGVVVIIAGAAIAAGHFIAGPGNCPSRLTRSSGSPLAGLSCWASNS